MNLSERIAELETQEQCENAIAIRARMGGVEMTELEFFALAVLAEHRNDLGDLEGGWLQDTAEAHGLLVRVTADKPCGEEGSCWCNGFYAVSDWPVECLRYSDEVQKMMETQR